MPARGNSLLRSGVIVSTLTFVSRVLGLLRDQAMAIVFGPSLATDAFLIAFRLPNMFRRLFAEGALSQAFVPLLNEYKTRHSRAALLDLIAHVFGMFGGFLCLLCLLAVLAAPLLVALMAPADAQADSARYAMAVMLARWTLPYLFFISMVTLAAGVLNSFGRFAVPAATPILLNLCLISAIVIFSQYTDPPVLALGMAVFCAGALQLLFQLPWLWRLRLLPRPRWQWQHAGVRRVVKLMLPALFGGAVSQLGLLFDTIIASMLAVGSITWLYYSDRMVELPLGVFGVALATVILPRLSQQCGRKEPSAFNATLDDGLRLGLLVGLPAMLGLMLLAKPILTTLFHYRAFGTQDVIMSAYSLVCYAPALPAFILIKLLSGAFFAMQDTRTPAVLGLSALGFKLVMSALGIWLVLRLDVPAHAGLALATSVFAWFYAALLYRALRKRDAYAPALGWWHLSARVLIGLGCMALLLIVGLLNTGDWFVLNLSTRIWQLGVLILAAVVIYGGILWLLGVRLQQFFVRA